MVVSTVHHYTTSCNTAFTLQQTIINSNSLIRACEKDLQSSGLQVVLDPRSLGLQCRAHTASDINCYNPFVQRSRPALRNFDVSIAAGFRGIVCAKTVHLRSGSWHWVDCQDRLCDCKQRYLLYGCFRLAGCAGSHAYILRYVLTMVCEPVVLAALFWVNGLSLQVHMLSDGCGICHGST